MKKIAAILLVVILATSLAPVFVLAAEGKSVKELEIGEKIVLDNDVVTTYLGKTPDGRHKFQAVIGEPKYLDDLTTPINCQWDYDATVHSWVLLDNFFEATVAGDSTSVEYEGSIMAWTPLVYIGGEIVDPVSIYPDLLPYDPVNENYTGNTLQWQYPGLTRNLRVIEGMLIEYYLIDSLPAGDIEIKSNVAKSAGYTYTRPVEVYDADYEPVERISTGIGDVVVTVEAMKSATFPVTIDPDSNFTTSASDGFARKQGALWATVRGMTYSLDDWRSMTTSGVYTDQTGGLYEIRRAYLFFNTASLRDDVTITDAELFCWPISITDNDDAEIYIVEGMPTYPHDPFTTWDYYYLNYDFDTNFGYVDASEQLTTGHYEKINYSNSGTLETIVNKTGATKLCLIERHDKENEQAFDKNAIAYYAYEQGVGYRPYLVVTYTAVTPTVVTEAASNVGVTTARLNSVVDDDGEEAVTIRFGWGESSETAIVDYDHYETVAGTFTTGQHPYLDVGSLTGLTLYYFRVEGTNAGGTDLGSELTFTTENAVGDPTNLTGIPAATTVSLTWTKGTGASNTLVRFGVSSYPTSTTDGFPVYNGASSSTVHSELIGGTTYYYSVWGESGGAYSSGYDTVMVTTSAEIVAGDDLTAPLTPSRWLSAPDYTNLSGLLFVYDGVNNSADALNMPRETLWMVLAMVLCLAIGLGAYMISGGKLFIGAIALVVALIFGWMVQIIPFWIPLLSGIMIVAYAVGHREVKTY